MGTKADPAVEVVGTVKRVLKRSIGDAERKPIDVEVHALIEARAAVKREREKANTAGLKLKHRGDEIQTAIDELHERWKEAEIDAIVECRVERTSTEVRVVRIDLGTVVSRRPLTKEEHTALGAVLPGMPAPKVLHQELGTDPATSEHLEKETAGIQTRATLVKPVKLDDVLAEIDEEAANEGGEDDDEEAPKKRGKRAANEQTEIPTGEPAKKPTAKKKGKK